MAISQLIPAFHGDAQGQSKFLLSDAYSSSGSKNLWIDKLGRIRTIDGFTRQNSTPYVTNTGADSARIRSMYMYRRIVSGTTRQLLFVIDDGANEVELWWSGDLGATGTRISTHGVNSVGLIWSFATFGDQLFIVNGFLSPRRWDGTSFVDVGTSSQLAAPTLSDGGAGPLNGAGYRYRLVPIRAAQERKIGSVASSALDVENRRITVSWTADSDMTVVGYELWRTTGSGLDYYLVAYIDGRTTTTYTDQLPDRDLILRPVMAVVAPHGDPPPTGTRFVVAHKSRLFWLGTAAFPRRFWWSDPGVPASIYTERNYSECTDAESIGDELRGGTGEYEGTIVLWMQNSVWVVSGTGTVIGGELDWRKRRSNSRTGTVHVRTVVKASQGSVYFNQEGGKIVLGKNMLAFLTPEKDIRLFDGQNDFIVSFPKIDTLKRMNTVNAYKSYSYDDSEHGMFVWVFPIDSATEPNYSVAWNYQYGTWHEWEGTNFGHVIEAESSTESVLLAGDARTNPGALIYKLWSGNQQDGVDIKATLMTKPIYPPIQEGGPPELSHEKREEAMILLFEKDATPTNVTIEVLPHDAADDASATVARTIAADSRKRIMLCEAANGANPGRFFHGVGVRFRISSDSDDGPWILSALQHLYVPLKGQTR